MSFDSSMEEEQNIEVLFEVVEQESSEEPPMDEWSSLVVDVPEENKKRVLYEQGLYDPGSGEVCTKYVTMSASSILKHPYYNYPAVSDPGINEALLEPEDTVIYASDGQDLYLAICNEMNQCPVNIFHKGLVNDIIDLKYYSVHSHGIRPMAIALKDNRHVTVLNLTESFLNEDSCFHLGEMLKTNTALRELILVGCKIGANGARKLFAGLTSNRSLCILNLNRNGIGDTGIEYLAEVVFQGIKVQQMLLRYNNISGKSANALAEAFETHNKFTHLDLSWNNYYTPGGTVNLLSRLSENKFLQEINLSWNSLYGPRVAAGLKLVLRAPNLRVLDLSNNKLNGEAISIIIENLGKAKKLVTFNLSYNPLTPEDAVNVLYKMKFGNVKVQNLLMENVFVDGEFLALLKIIKGLKSRKNAVITYGGVIGGYTAVGPDMRDLVLNRVEFLGKKSKRYQADIALIAMQLLKDGVEIMPGKDFATILSDTGAPIDSNLIDEIVNTFPGGKSTKLKTISIANLVDYTRRKWPDRKLPPTPPPEPEPEPEPEPIPEPVVTKKNKKK